MVRALFWTKKTPQKLRGKIITKGGMDL